ncbi:MAG TPA: serine/threonine-protein kinase [Phycisphaerales bacterium]|nr:serine/threonine-protein kinase [Phycisphaerales bacterium]
MIDRRKVRALYAEAELLPAGERSAFLHRVCADDPALRREVESLLAAGQSSPDFLASPTVGGVPGGHGESPGDHIGPYRLLQQVGRGGFGTVYMAEQESPVRRKVALKIVTLGMDTRAVIARFEAERQALALMDHPHIAKVFDAGSTASGRPYFVMELVAGDPITVYADRESLTIRERLDLFRQVCYAVQHAHAKGVIHRDLKPSNILVATQDGRPHAKVIDFGIAKATEHRLTERTLFTEFRQFIGTPEYMSPEQAGGSPDVDTRSDIYSLGVLLYELITGATPFDARELRAVAYDEIQRIIREVEPPKPSTRISRSDTPPSVADQRRTDLAHLGTQVSGDLDWIVMKALEKDRSRRYETPSALAADIDRHLSGEPVVAAPPSWGYRARKFVRRNRVLVASAAGIAAALSLGIIGTTTGLVLAVGNAERAEQEAQRADEKAAESDRRRAEAEYEGYIANIESAYGALVSNDATRLRTRLDACPPSLRKWEWRYLDSASDGSILVMTHPRRNVQWVAMSRDGSRVVSSSGDGKARIWNAATGVELAAITGPDRFVGKVAYSPDGSLVLAAALNGQIVVWDAVTFAEVAVLKGHTLRVTSVAFIDNARVVSASDDGTARIWDAKSGAELRRMTHDGPIHQAALDAGSTRLATGSRDTTVRLWELDHPGEPMVLRGHTDLVAFVRWSADRTRVVSASYDGSARVWDARTGAQLARFQHDARVLLASFSADGSRVVSSASAGPPCVWDSTTGEKIFQLDGHTNTVLSACFSRDDRWILTSSRDNSVRLWDARTGAEWSCLRGHTETPWVAEFTPDGQRIMTCGDTSVRLWPIAQDSQQSIIQRPLPDSAICLSRDQSTVLEVGDYRVRLIDLVTGRETHLFENTDPSGAAALSLDGSRAFVAFNDNIVREWDVKHGTAGVLLSGHTNWVHCISLDPDGSRIVTASEDGTARVWDAVTGQELARLVGHDGAVNAARFDPSGTRVVTAGRDKTVRVWDAESGNALHALRWHDNSVLDVCFSADGSRILSTSVEYTARVWNAATGERLLLLRGHEHVVNGGGFSPDGARIVTSSMDGTVRLWDATNGRQILSIRGRFGGATRAEFTPDGEALVFSDTEGRAWFLGSVPMRERFARRSAGDARPRP